MNITRREHAAQILERDGARLVIDPGVFTEFDATPTDVAAIVITHEHDDHWDAGLVGSILASNPGALVVGTRAVSEAAPELGIRVVRPGDTVDADPFDLRFFGGKHASIHATIPEVDNVGVLVNSSLFYGGDSFEPPGVEVDTLAVTVSAPWMKLGEMMDYILAVQPKRTYPVHDLLNSTFGNAKAKTRAAWSVEQGGGSHLDINVGDTVEL